MIKDLSIEDILSSKIYVKEGSAVGFKSPGDYLGDFIAEAAGANWRVKVADPVVNEEISGARNIAYPRVMVEAQLGELIPHFEAVVGMVYALDLQKPVIKTYSGFNVHSCINLSIFNTDNMFQQELLGDFEKVISMARKYFLEKEKDVIDFKDRFDKLQSSYLTEPQLNELLGKMLRESSKTRLGTTPILGAAKLLDDSSTTYYVRPDGKFTCNKFNVYNAVTQMLTNSNDIIDRPNKTIALTKLLLN